MHSFHPPPSTVGLLGCLPSLWTHFQNLFHPLLCLQLHLALPPRSQTHTSICFLLGAQGFVLYLIDFGKLGQGVGVGTEGPLATGKWSALSVSLQGPWGSSAVCMAGPTSVCSFWQQVPAAQWDRRVGCLPSTAFLSNTAVLEGRGEAQEQESRGRHRARHRQPRPPESPG